MCPGIGGLATFNLLFVDRVIYGRSIDKSDDWKTVLGTGFKKREIEESVSLAGIVVSRIIVVPIVIALAWIEAGSILGLVSVPFMGGLVVGLSLIGPAGLFLRRAHLISDNREIIALQYLIPVLALVWLGAFADIQVNRIELLIYGTVTIVATNMLINIDPEASGDDRQSGESIGEMHQEHDGATALPIRDRYSLKALVVSLLGFGMIVHFRGEIFRGQEFSWWPGRLLGNSSSCLYGLCSASCVSTYTSRVSVTDGRLQDVWYCASY